jgi:hypothetical protein
MVNLGKSLDIIFEDPEVVGHHPLDDAMGLVRELHNAQQRILDIQHELGKLKHRLAADLALSLRRAKPGLNVAVDKHGCKVGYKTKHLQFIPEIDQEMWRVVSPNSRFVREFMNRHRRATFLTADMAPLVNAILTHFTEYYRTLGEEIEGTGLILVEDRKVTLIDLAEWRLSTEPAPQRLLMSRRARQVVNG